MQGTGGGIIIPSQMLKGILENCILKIIKDKKCYGYEISEKLSEYGFDNISEGTIYPLLLRLEKNNLIDKEYVSSTTGPKRKYFFLTKLGEEELEQFFINWDELEACIRNLRN